MELSIRLGIFGFTLSIHPFEKHFWISIQYRDSYYGWVGYLMAHDSKHMTWELVRPWRS